MSRILPAGKDVVKTKTYGNITTSSKPEFRKQMGVWGRGCGAVGLYGIVMITGI
jgi:hypothetical protein